MAEFRNDLDSVKLQNCILAVACLPCNMYNLISHLQFTVPVPRI